MLPPDRAWQRLRHMQEVVAHQPAIAYAVHCLPLYDKLELRGGVRNDYTC